MREVITIATMFLMLAVGGMRPSTQVSAKTCRVVATAAFLPLTC